MKDHVLIRIGELTVRTDDKCVGHLRVSGQQIPVRKLRIELEAGREPVVTTELVTDARPSLRPVLEPTVAELAAVLG